MVNGRSTDPPPAPPAPAGARDPAGGEVQLALLRAIAEGTGDMIAAQDRDFRYLYFNDAYRREFERLWGRELAIGTSMVEAMSPWPEEERKARELWRRALRGESFRVALEFGPTEADKQVYDLRFDPIVDAEGRRIGAVHVLRNVTVQARRERALHESEARLRETASALERANERLRAVEERYRLVNRATHDVVWDWDLTTGALLWNEAIERTFGYRLAEVPAEISWWDEHLHPDDRERVVSSLRAAIEDPAQRSWAAEYRFQHRDGRWVDVLDRGHVARDGAGRGVRMIGSMLDLTARNQGQKALRESEARFRQLADAMPQLVWTARPDGTVDYYNERVNELSGARRHEDGTWSWHAVLHPDDRQPTVEAWRRAVRTGERYEIAHRVMRADGSLHWYLSRAVAARDAEGRVVRWYGTATDIDAQKRAEEALRASDRHKNDFLAVLSHELRNPLAPIRNGVYILEHAAPGGDQAARARRVIDRQVQHMTRLVEDLLDVTRISRGKITLQRERVDLTAIARGAAEDHRDLFARGGVRLEVAAAEPPLHVHGDATRLAQVIGNLLGNAAKFTSAGGTTTLSVAAGRPGEAIVRVRDDGAGMSPATLERLFEPFVQAEQTLERSRGGLGLGLALVKGLVELHGGTVEVRSDGEGRGTEVTVRLPRAPPEAVAGAPATDAGRPGTVARRVLVVEDNVDAAESLREVLELGPHEVAVAYTGAEGLERARAFRPDVVLCDIGLPGLTGYDVARELRADPDPLLRSTYLVALSGYALQEDVLRSLEAGFDRHVAKPPRPETLEELLRDGPARRGPSSAGG